MVSRVKCAVVFYFCFTYICYLHRVLLNICKRLEAVIIFGGDTGGQSRGRDALFCVHNSVQGNSRTNQ